MQMDGGEALLLEPVTEQIIGCAFRVATALGQGFVEKVYQNTLAHERRGRLFRYGNSCLGDTPRSEFHHARSPGPYRDYPGGPGHQIYAARPVPSWGCPIGGGCRSPTSTSQLSTMANLNGLSRHESNTRIRKIPAAGSFSGLLK
jgi:hypothetical protein